MNKPMLTYTQCIALSQAWEWLTIDTPFDVELIDSLINMAIYRNVNFPIFLIDHVCI